GHTRCYRDWSSDVCSSDLQALPAVPSQLTFVDFGCGKGRALVLAAEHGFRRVLGIECDAQLFAAAQRNARAYRDAARRIDDIEIDRKSGGEGKARHAGDGG